MAEKAALPPDTSGRPVNSNPGEPSVLRAASAMGIATFFSRILGLVREQVFAVLFGAGNATDAFNIAFRIPNLLRDLFAEGAMSAALIPTFTRVRKEEGERRAWRLAGLVFRVLGVSVGILAAIGMIFAGDLVRVYASSFQHVPGKLELTIAMTRTMFPFFPLVATAAAFMGILNACGKFFLPAFSSALFNLTSIVTGVALSTLMPRFGHQPIEGMAYGVVLGGLVQALCQLPSLYRAGYRWSGRHPTEDLAWHRDPALRRMLLLMVPGTVGLAATQINMLVNSVLATSQAPGAVSWLGYSFRLLQFPIGLFGASLASATLPKVSRQWVERDFQGASGTLVQSLRHVFAINLPASAGLAFLGFPIIQLLFQYGHFRAEDAQATALALGAYSLGLTAYSAVKVLVPAFYAFGNTRIPVVSSMVAVACTIALNLMMIGPFGYVGLAMGTSIAAILNCLFLLMAARRLMQRSGAELKLGPIAAGFGLHLVVALVMGGACFFSYQLLNPLLPEQAVATWIGHGGVPLLRALKVGIVVAEGLGVVLIVSKLLGIRETSEIFDLFTKKLKKKLSGKKN